VTIERFCEVAPDGSDSLASIGFQRTTYRWRSKVLPVRTSTNVASPHWLPIGSHCESDSISTSPPVDRLPGYSITVLAMRCSWSTSNSVFIVGYSGLVGDGSVGIVKSEPRLPMDEGG